MNQPHTANGTSAELPTLEELLSSEVRFRLGDGSADGWTEFRARRKGFHDRVVDALIDHRIAGRAGVAYIQVHTGARWGAIDASSKMKDGRSYPLVIVPSFAGDRELALLIFDCACKCVVIMNRMDALRQLRPAPNPHG